MLSQSSLVKRLTLMIMFAVISVLVVAGISVNMLSQHHFRMLDEQALSEKLESTRHILSIQTPGTRQEELREQLRAAGRTPRFDGGNSHLGWRRTFF